jgi:hypothetical protein
MRSAWTNSITRFLSRRLASWSNAATSASFGSVDPDTLSEDGYFTPLFGGSIDLGGEHRAEAHHAWEAVKANGVDLRLGYMLRATDEAGGAAHCKSWT